MAKISSPYPAHVILYGPPGVGKTTAARLVLELAKSRAYTPFAKDAPFVETSGTTLRWDPRETTNPLWAAFTIRSIRAAGASSPKAAFPSPNSAW